MFGAWWLFLRAPTTDVDFLDAPDRRRPASPCDSWTSITATVFGLAGILDEPTFDQTVAQIAAAALFASLVVRSGDATGPGPGELLGRPDGAGRAASHPPVYPPAGSCARPRRSGTSIRRPFFSCCCSWRWRRSARVRGWAALALTGVLVLGLVYNVDRLRDGGATARLDSQRALAQYTVYEMAGSRLREDFKPSEFAATAGEYADAAARYGSVTEPIAGARGGALRWFARRLTTRWPDPSVWRSAPLRGSDRPGRGRHAWFRSSGPRWPAARGASACGRAAWPAEVAPTTVPLEPEPVHDGRPEAGDTRGGAPTAPKLAELSAPSEGLVLSAPDISKTAILVGRFAPPSAQLDRPERARFGTLRFPADGLTPPWRVIVASSEPVTVCGLTGR